MVFGLQEIFACLEHEAKVGDVAQLAECLPSGHEALEGMRPWVQCPAPQNADYEHL